MNINLDPQKRLDIVLYVEANNSNPNGDPDSDNMPRTDPVTGRGTISSVSIKRKIRNMLEFNGDKLFMAYDGSLAERTPVTKFKGEELERYVRETYIDARLFGAVLTKGGGANGKNPIQVRGPIQVSMGESIAPVNIKMEGITRGVHQTKEDAENKGGGTMGSRYSVTHGLYRFTISYNPIVGLKAGVTEEDLRKFVNSLNLLYNIDQADNRAEVDVARIDIFQHDNALGVCRWSQATNLSQAKLKNEVEEPTSVEDYDFKVSDTVSGLTHFSF